MQNYKVIRAHWGSKEYKVGDIRKARREQVAHLIGRCLVLEEDKPAEKMAEDLENKAGRKLRNKAAD